MARVTKSVVLRCDPERAMEYIADVKNHPAFIGPLKAVDNISGDSRVAGTTWDWTFVMAGVEFSGKAETVSYTPGKQFTYRTTTGIESTFVYRLEPADGGARLTVDVQYEVPGSLLAKLQRRVVEKLNDAEGARAVENLGVILEE